MAFNKKNEDFYFKQFPNLRYFYSGEHGDKSYFVSKDFPCWFLTEDSLCEIEQTYGYEKKPILCRHHPFYVNVSLDEHIVMPRNCVYLFASHKSKKSSYDRIKKEAQESIRLDLGIRKLKMSKEELVMEHQVFLDSKEFLKSSNYFDFAAHQVLLADRRRTSSTARSKLGSFRDLLINLLELEELSLDNKNLTYDLVVLTPLLRLECLKHRLIEVEDFPFALLSLYVYMILFSSIRTAQRCYFDTCMGMLYRLVENGLLEITADDLPIKFLKIEDKLLYLRKFRMMEKKQREAKKKAGKTSNSD